MFGGRRDGALMKKVDGGFGRRSKIAAAVFVGMFLGCVLAFVHPGGFFAESPAGYRAVASSDSEVRFLLFVVLYCLYVCSLCCARLYFEFTEYWPALIATYVFDLEN